MTTCDYHEDEFLVPTVDAGLVCLRCQREGPTPAPTPQATEDQRLEAILRRNRDILKARGWRP